MAGLYHIFPSCVLHGSQSDLRQKQKLWSVIFGASNPVMYKMISLYNSKEGFGRLFVQS